jgi:hypothetical protein
VTFGVPVVAVIDADDAGCMWGERLTEHVVAAGGSLRVVEPPTAGLDLNDWARYDPTWRRVVVCASHVPELSTAPPGRVQSIEVSAIAR